ncbi:MAG: hypothetical protein ACFFDI_23220 [Promethearchaeota archaeon]
MRCMRCGHEWIPRTAKPKHCPRCNSPYWNKPKVKQSGPKRNSEPSWMTKAYELDSGVRIFAKGRVKIENLSVDGPPRQKIIGKPGIGINSGQPSYQYINVDRRDDNTTTIMHTVKEKMDNGEWVEVHRDKKKGKAKHRPKKKEEK